MSLRPILYILNRCYETQNTHPVTHVRMHLGLHGNTHSLGQHTHTHAHTVITVEAKCLLVPAPWATRQGVARQRGLH